MPNFSLEFYKEKIKEIALKHGMNGLDIQDIEAIKTWEEIHSIIDFLSQCYGANIQELSLFRLKDEPFNEWEMS